MIFINTRPILQAKPLSQYIANHNVIVYDLPLLEIIPLAINDASRMHLERMVQGGYDALVTISPNAVELGLKHYYKQYESSFNPQCPIIAVGNATAQAFTSCLNKSINTKNDIQNLHIACPKSPNNESMIVMPQLASLTSDQRVLIWRGQGGRRLLVNHLQDKGVVVDSIEWYKRQRPATALYSLHQICQTIGLIKNEHNKKVDSKVCVLISSGESFEHWCHLLQEYKHINATLRHPPKLSDFSYIVLGDRLATILSHHHTTDNPLNYHRVSSLDPNDIMKGLTHLSDITPKP